MQEYICYPIKKDFFNISGITNSTEVNKNLFLLF